MTSPHLNCAGYERQGHSGRAWLNERKGTGAKAIAAPVLDIIQKRLEQLAAHGYVEMRKGQWELTEKGLCRLIACAEPPMPKPMPPRYLTRHDILDRYGTVISSPGQIPISPSKGTESTPAPGLESRQARQPSAM